MKTWYSTALVMSCEVGGMSGRDASSFLQTHLLQAENHEQAYELAQQIGKECETQYDNQEGERVSWVFKGLQDLQELGEKLSHGDEISSLKIDSSAPGMIVSKEELTVFWLEANEDKTVAEVLGDNDDGV